MIPTCGIKYFCICSSLSFIRLKSINNSKIAPQTIGKDIFLYIFKSFTKSKGNKKESVTAIFDKTTPFNALMAFVSSIVSFFDFIEK